MQTPLAIEFDLKQQTVREISLTSSLFAASDANKVYWVHCDLANENNLEMLNKILNLPKDVLEMCVESTAVPRMIDHDVSLTIQVQVPLSMQVKKNKQLQFTNLILHLTERYCFTASKQAIPVITEFLEAAQSGVRYAQTSCFILFLILDGLINEYAHIIFSYEVLEEKMDMQVHKQTDVYDRIVHIKQQVIKLKRAIIAIREMITRICSRQIAVISPACRTSLNNLSSHAHMLVHEADSMRDILNNLLGQIDNNLMTKLNQTMRVLTAFAAIFLPLSLITGIYGMNFHWIPELEWKYGYFWALGLMFLFGLLLLFIFKKFKWF